MSPTSSRLAAIKPAVRPELRARLMISGGYGSGKTRTTLYIARKLAGPNGRILGIDTEQGDIDGNGKMVGSMLTYADEFEFDHLPWESPYSPAELGETLRGVTEYDVIVVDSMTHFWLKEGGTFQIGTSRTGGWNVARPIQEEMVKAILQCPAHVLLCVRSKMKWDVSEGLRDGRKVMTYDRMGVEPQQDGDLGYELNVALDIDKTHTMTITKTRCAELPEGREFRAGFHNVDEFIRVYSDWLKAGEPLIGRAESDALIEMFNDIPGKEDQRLAKVRFANAFGKPNMLRAKQIEDAERWITDYIERGGPAPEGDPAAGGAEGGTAPAADATADEGAKPVTEQVAEPDIETEHFTRLVREGVANEADEMFLDAFLVEHPEVAAEVLTLIEDEQRQALSNGTQVSTEPDDDAADAAWHTNSDGPPPEVAPTVTEAPEAASSAAEPPEAPEASEPTPGQTLLERAAALTSKHADGTTNGHKPAPAAAPVDAPYQRKAPSMAELEREGITSEQVDAILAEVNALSNSEVGHKLTEMGLALGDSPQVRARRLAMAIAFDTLAKPRTDNVTPIGAANA